MRSDNGLIYQSRRVRTACRDYRLRQESITSYTPEQNGIIERFLPEPEGRVRLAASVPELPDGSSRDGRGDPLVPHQALGYRSPRDHRAQQGQLVASFRGEHYMATDGYAFLQASGRPATSRVGTPIWRPRRHSPRVSVDYAASGAQRQKGHSMVSPALSDSACLSLRSPETFGSVPRPGPATTSRTWRSDPPAGTSPA